MEHFNLSLLEKLTNAGPRLTWIKKWLIEEIWSRSHYQAVSPIEYLKKGEESVNRFETLIAASADRIYEELLSLPDAGKNILNALSDSQTAVVVYDGLSLREIPIMIKLAEKSGFKIVEISCSHAAIPSETMHFIERELKCAGIGPSQLVGRRELTDRGITALYSGSPTQSIGDRKENNALLA